MNSNKTAIKTRNATNDDAQCMSEILTEILIMQGSDRPRDPKFIAEFYIEHPDNIQCTIAQNSKGIILGFQILKRASENNQYGVTPGWGIIGTYVKLDAGRQGIGSSLFATTLRAAKEAGLTKIDATIGKDNKLGLAYYEAMGFVTYRTTSSAICKVFALNA